MVRDELVAALVRFGLCRPDQRVRFEALTGGVSSDIWRVDLGDRVICVKRALAKLRVDADWFAPVERNGYEAAWMQVAGGIVPDAVPALLGHDRSSGCLAMAFLPADRFDLWKDRLRRGDADATIAASVGERLVRIHAATAGDPDIRARFATDRIFHDIRLEPYLLATAHAHPDRAQALRALAETTGDTKLALVHGDVSPKNILIGPDGPVFLDAECAWFGDPAFDLAFCLNHLLLKCVWVPGVRAAFLDCFEALAETYLAGVDWEERAGIEARTAALLSGLLLGRVDGRSPVEYLDRQRGRDMVRSVARGLLAEPVTRLRDVKTVWQRALATGSERGGMD